MATFDDDFVRIHCLCGKDHDFKLMDMGFEWPPPQEIYLGAKYRQIGRSQITDEERNGMTHVCRGAEYEPVAP